LQGIKLIYYRKRRIIAAIKNIILYGLKNNMKEYNYTVILEREEDGGFHAFCPALRGCHTYGDTYDEASENIKDAIKLYIESLKIHKRINRRF
jgi:predicted RNase H-like HicB family nuclease